MKPRIISQYIQERIFMKEDNATGNRRIVLDALDRANHNAMPELRSLTVRIDEINAFSYRFLWQEDLPDYLVGVMKKFNRGRLEIFEAEYQNLNRIVDHVSKGLLEVLKDLSHPDEGYQITFAHAGYPITPLDTILEFTDSDFPEEVVDVVEQVPDLLEAFLPALRAGVPVEDMLA